MDKIDNKILQLLQQDSTLSTAAIAEQVGLSPTPCWRRIQNMERSGLIRSRVALLDRNKLDLGVDVFVTLKVAVHNSHWLESLAQTLDSFDEIVECYRMSGDIDYLLRVVVKDISAYDAFYKRLIDQVEVADLSSSFAMEQMKYSTALPLASNQ